MAKQKVAKEWQPAVQELHDEIHPVERNRWPELILGALLLVETIVLPGRIVLSLAVLALLVALAVTRKPTRKIPSWLPVLFVGLIVFLTLSSLANGVSTETMARRVLKISLIMCATLILMSGRLHAQSLLKGFVGGLVVNAALFYAGVAPRPYGTALSGWIGDKNRAGLYYAMATLVVLPLIRRRNTMILVVLAGMAAVWGTQSRTSIAALGLGLIWLFLGSQAGLVARLVLFGVLIWVLEQIESRFAHIGPFQDRSGSDLLRLEIDISTQAKIGITPWYGLGAAQGVVQARGSTWFLHNAYATVFVEGGWVLIIGVVFVTVTLGSRVFAKRPIPWTHVCSDAATVTLLICATRLGDVFLTVPWMLLLGMASVIYPHGPPKADPDAELPAGISSPLRR